ncbi:MAG: PrsW family intramembrane metalloprotease [Verrucomicrobiota bacterium]
MTLLLASVLLGIIPMVIYALIVWHLDRWEKEPLHLMIAAFVWGFLPSAVFAIIAQAILDLPIRTTEPPSLTVELYSASIVAPLTEEFIKGLGVLLVFIIFRNEIDSVLDGLVYGSMVGFGFSAVENILYFSTQPDAASLLFLFVLRAIVFGMLHALFTGLFGVGLALGKFSRSFSGKLLWPLLGLALAMVTHAMHNYFATVGGETIFLAFLGVACGVIWFVGTVCVCLYHENRWIRIYLSDEVDRGVLHANQAIDAATFSARGIPGMFRHGLGDYLKRRRLLARATKLAYQKRLEARLGPTPARHRLLEKLRAEVSKLSGIDPLLTSGRIVATQSLPPPLPPLRRMPPSLPERG